MLTAIKNLLGFGPKTDYAELVKQGAIILDVRTKSEFTTGHIKGAINIPVDQIVKNLSKLKDRNKAIITCCESGSRSGMAKRVLKSNAYVNVYNGGSWYSLNGKL